MKKRKLDLQQEKEVKKYYLKGYHSLKKIKAEHDRGRSRINPLNYLSNEPINSMERVILIESNQSSIEKILTEANEIPHIKIDKETLYIQNISQFDDEFQSIIYPVNGPPVKSKESPFTIMNRYFKQTEVPYELIQQIGKLVGITKFCPYIVGDSCFIPDLGRSHSLTSWLALHHIVESESLSATNETRLFCRNNQRIIFSLKYKRFTKRIEQATSIYHIQRSLIHFLTSFYTKEITIHIEEPVNVIHQFLVQMRFSLPAYTLTEIIGHLKYFWASEALKKEFGIEDPYFIQLRNYFEGTNLIKESKKSEN